MSYHRCDVPEHADLGADLETEAGALDVLAERHAELAEVLGVVPGEAVLPAVKALRSVLEAAEGVLVNPYGNTSTSPIAKLQVAVGNFKWLQADEGR